MGNQTTSGKSRSKRRRVSEELAETINEVESSQYKVFITGIESSGKSTIFKQLLLTKYTNLSAYLPDEAINIQMAVRNYIVNFVKFITYMSSNLKGNNVFREGQAWLQLVGVDFSVSFPVFQNFDIPTFDADISRKFLQLWKNPKAQEFFLESREHSNNIPETFTYFVQNLSRILAPTYVPTKQDYLSVYYHSNGIYEESFKLKDTKLFVYDTGGKYVKRIISLLRYSDSNLYIFCISLADFDQYFENDLEEVNESFAHFVSFISNDKVSSTQRFMIYFTKRDILQDLLFNMESRKESLLDFCPQLELDRDYFWAQLKIEEYILNAYVQAIDRCERDISQFSFHFISSFDEDIGRVTFKNIRDHMTPPLIDQKNSAPSILTEQEFEVKSKMHESNEDLESIERELQQLGCKLSHPLYGELKRFRNGFPREKMAIRPDWLSM